MIRQCLRTGQLSSFTSRNYIPCKSGISIQQNYIVTSLTKSSVLIMNNNYFSPVIVKYEKKSLVIVNIACQSLSLSLYQGFTVSTVTIKHVCKVLARRVHVQPSFGHPFLEEIQGKLTLSLIIIYFMGKQAFWKASFQCLAKSLHV